MGFELFEVGFKKKNGVRNGIGTSCSLGPQCRIDEGTETAHNTFPIKAFGFGKLWQKIL